MVLKTSIAQPGTAAKSKIFKYKLNYRFTITHICGKQYLNMPKF